MRKLGKDTMTTREFLMMLHTVVFGVFILCRLFCDVINAQMFNQENEGHAFCREDMASDILMCTLDVSVTGIVLIFFYMTFRLL